MKKKKENYILHQSLAFAFLSAVSRVHLFVPTRSIPVYMHFKDIITLSSADLPLCESMN
jgi:hypothetical protein